MKLVVRVQYIGERARLLLREDLAAEYTKGLIDDLEVFGFPVPHEQKPIEKSGFMLCVWHVERDSETHRIIQNAFMRAKAEAASLMDRSIRYISLNEDGVLHTTSLSNKPYKPKSYNKPTFGNHQIQDIKPFGKAPKYPTSISQARKGVTPLSQRISGVEPSSHDGSASSYYGEYGSRDVEMRQSRAHTPPPASGSEASSNSVIDVTQKTLLQLSQSSAFQSLMQRSPPSPTRIKLEPAPPPDLSSLPPRPAATPSAQPQIPNLQALLEKAGVKSSSVQALLSAQNGLPPKPAPTSYASGANLVPGSSATTSSIASTSSLSFTSVGTRSSVPTTTSSLSSLTSTPPTSNGHTGKSASISSRPHSTTPAPPPGPTRARGSHALTRELWDVRRQISALQAQEGDLESEMRRSGQSVPPKEGTNSVALEQRVKALEDEISALREELSREQQSRRVQEALLRAERLRRTEVETMMHDTSRECKQPFVVPALLDAFMKIGQMTGDALKDSHGGAMPMEL
ncbi:hypothetical protein GSI_10585 [Ganoderma sinense ZZ0214-1]|uniref:Uncharacterized protein n=1 Tax=Ganoderma sinense ZZ0214-1 TaxID=1077348 RepID=A0A2G8S120_9APHY|nr:hypothetical protein GSI_10585 [Ganoderma sinense ZZ0214-1]